MEIKEQQDVQMRTKELVFYITKWKTKTKEGLTLHLFDNLNSKEFYNYKTLYDKSLVYNKELISVASKVSNFPITSSNFKKDVWK